jgi:hypothetical protein
MGPILCDLRSRLADYRLWAAGYQLIGLPFLVLTLRIDVIVQRTSWRVLSLIGVLWASSFILAENLRLRRRNSL